VDSPTYAPYPQHIENCLGIGGKRVKRRYMKNLWYVDGFLIKMVSITVVVIIFLMLLLCSFEINCVNTVPVKVYIDGNLVYEGKSGCVSVNSAGRTTAVTVEGGFLCMWPIKEYVSDNVHIEGVK
jgi:hypothetical protein